MKAWASPGRNGMGDKSQKNTKNSDYPPKGEKLSFRGGMRAKFSLRYNSRLTKLCSKAELKLTSTVQWCTCKNVFQKHQHAFRLANGVTLLQNDLLNLVQLFSHNLLYARIQNRDIIVPTRGHAFHRMNNTLVLREVLCSYNWVADEL